MGTLIVNPYFKLWTPADLSVAPIAWYDASNESSLILDGSSVSQWNDLSGNNRHLTQATSDNKPTYSGNSVDFDGINDNLSVSTWGDIPPPYSMISVVTASNSINANERIFASSATNVALYYRSSSTVSFYTGASGGDINVSNGETFILSGSLGSNQLADVRKNGDGGIATGGTSTIRGLLIGDWTGMTIPSEIKSRENYLFDYAITGDDLERLEGYLAHKWGLAANLPVTHLYKNTPPYV